MINRKCPIYFFIACLIIFCSMNAFAMGSKGGDTKAAEEKTIEKKTNKTKAIETKAIETKATETKATEDKVAIINGNPIYADKLNIEIDRALNSSKTHKDSLNEEQLYNVKTKVLNRLIEEELLFQETQKEKITVTDNRVLEEIEKIKKNFSKPEEYEAILKNLNLTENDLKLQLKRSISIQELINNKIAKDIKISDEDCKKFYDDNQNMFKRADSVNAMHILVKVDNSATDEDKEKAKKKIEDIQKELKAGADFSELAKKYSDCPSGKEGGNLGFFSKGQMVKSFEDAAFNMEIGQVSDIVTTNFGYHLIKVIDKQKEMSVPYEEVKDQLARNLKQEKVSKSVGSYVTELKEKAKIEVFLKKNDEIKN
ncbi:MAG: peptidylprolyl isomerase [Desulfobacterales bacterium]|nr:peptidylprolyl isomerase [Desulfobacterales bacterium]